MEHQSLPDPLRSMIDSELSSDEQVTWAGQPDPSRAAWRALPICLFGIPFAGFAIFWISSAVDMGAPGVFPLFGIPFVLVGFGMLLSPLWMAHKSKKTAYVLTNQRAIIFEGGWSTHVRSFGPSDFDRIERRQKSDGSGDVIFAREHYYQSGHYSGSGSSRHYHSGGWRTREIGFFGIPDVKDVEAMLRDLANPQ